MLIDAGVDILLHTQLIGAVTEDRKIKAVHLAKKSGIVEMSADFFIDASGDGDLMAFSGCDFQLGRESDGLCQPMTTCFRLSNVDIEKYKKDKPRLQELYRQLKSEGKIKNPRESVLTCDNLGKGIVHFNSTRVVKLDNLLVAGRCLSATHEAHSAVRIMPICACLGEAAGVAAAEALHSQKTAHTLDVSALQKALVANGAQIH